MKLLRIQQKARLLLCMYEAKFSPTSNKYGRMLTLKCRVFKRSNTSLNISPSIPCFRMFSCAHTTMLASSQIMRYLINISYDTNNNRRNAKPFLDLEQISSNIKYANFWWPNMAFKGSNMVLGECRVKWRIANTGFSN